MSSSKVKLFSRTLLVTNDVVTGTGPYTHTLTTPTHFLQTADVVAVTLETSNGVETFSPAVTYISTTSVSVSLTTSAPLINKTLVVESYGAGMTGPQNSVTWPQASAPGVIQVVSTGAATVLIEGSLDNTNFANLTTFTLAAAGTDYIVMDANWAFIRANITSIAATKAVKIYRSV